MTGQRILTVTLVALLALGGSVAPALGSAGGAAPGVLILPDGSPLTVKLGNPVVRASGDGLAVAVRSTLLLRGRARIAGAAPRGTGTVTIERRDELAGWVATASAAVAADGRFVVVWRPDRLGPLQLRAVTGLPGAGVADGPDPAHPPQLDVTVYRPGIASWYGPTEPDQTTACGVPLNDATLGVAHRTLPCGTPVAFYYRGRTITVPVIDRGPFMAGRSWDLTQAAYTVLGGDDGLIRVGALPTPAPPAAASAR
jgi:rare lipoprotein A